jgi:hypothetical protein
MNLLKSYRIEGSSKTAKSTLLISLKDGKQIERSEYMIFLPNGSPILFSFSSSLLNGFRSDVENFLGSDDHG